MASLVITALLFFAAIPHGTKAQGQDLTLQEGSSGSAVVAAALARIQLSNIFVKDNEMLRRIAYVETRDGADSDTYREGYHGGIWAVNEALFQDTQDVASHPALTAVFQQIDSVFAISWNTVEWNDLRKPLYSALAARIYLFNVPESIPSVVSVQSQAEYWRRNYNTAGSTTAFVSAVNQLDSLQGMLSVNSGTY